MGKITVIGSSNIDMTAYVRRLPRPGETIGGGKFRQANGGKGANQAVAAARLGGNVLFITCVGDDMQGRLLERTFSSEGIDTSAMKFSGSTATGTALIFVADDGENCIAVAPGANSELTADDMDALREQITSAEYLLTQLEIPMQTVERAVEAAYSAGRRVVLNPAPLSSPLPDGLLGKVWLVTPNETEAEELTGIHIETANDAKLAAEALVAKGVPNVIITLGSDGSAVLSDGVFTIVPARTVTAVDTVGAGDAYNGALVTALSEGMSLVEAARFATVASSIAVTREGAQTGDPYRSEVDAIYIR
ncbi:MAG: ribokinase [Bacteroidales bacterium]|nr:ribokinase [Bacteroidales bacterium]